MRSPQVTYVSVAYTHAVADSRVRRHCETIARRGWRVFQLGLARAHEASVARVNGVVYVRYQRPRYRGNNLLQYAWAYARFFLWARRLLTRLNRRHAVAVVHANNIPNLIVWVASAARRAGTGVILDIHDPVPELFLCKFSRQPGARLTASGLRLEERLSARNADVVLCVHDAHRELTEQHGVDKRKLRVVLNAADGSLFPMVPPRCAEPFIVYHGTLTDRMGLDAVLRAFRLMHDRGTCVRAAFWGDGDVVDDLRRLRDQLGLADTVDIPGTRVVLEKLVPRLRTVGIAIAPMRRDAFTDCLLPTKLLEVVRLGIPSVVTWTPTVSRHFPEDTVHYVRDFTPEGIARVLQRVLADPEDARRRAVRAQALSIAMSWQDLEDEFVRIVEDLALTRRPRGWQDD